MRMCWECNDFVEDNHRHNSRAKSEAVHPFTTRKGKKISRAIKKRDDWECKRCVIKFKIMDKRKDEDLETHHIKSWRDYPELWDEPTNLICVCRKCNLELGNSNALDFPYEFPPMPKASL